MFDIENFMYRIYKFFIDCGIVVINKMSEEILVILKVMSLIVYSGNIVNWNRLKRYLNYGVIVEVIFCLFISFKNSIEVM